MRKNQFENSRISEGSMQKGAQKVADGPHKAQDESKAISRDDVRDGAVNPAKRGRAKKRAAK